ncbi:MAG TPA: LptF/LptG family permease [Vulgatibacter sp.]
MFWEVLPPFVGALLFFTQIFFVARMLTAADVIFGSAVDPRDVLGVLGYLLPSMLIYAVPVAFLLGVLIGLGRLGDDRELTALAATGHGPRSLLPMPLLIAGGLTGLMLMITVWAAPVGLRHAQTLMNDIIRRNLATGVKPGVFYEDLSNLTVFASEVDKKDGSLRNVLVEDSREEKSPILVLARSGRILPSDPSGALVLRLEEGDLHRAQPKSGDYALATFSQADVAVIMDREISRKNSLKRRLENQTPAELKENYRYWLQRDDDDRSYLVEYHRRFAHPFLHFSLALVGVGVAGSVTTGRKPGKAVAISWTVGAVVAYFVLGKILGNFGNHGSIPAWLASWAPVLIIGGVGAAMLALRSGSWRRAR